MEFDYLNDVPILTLDVDEDFKGDKVKCADMVEKVRDSFIYDCIWLSQINNIRFLLHPKISLFKASI